MNEIKTQSKSGVISKIESTAPRVIKGVTRPGNPRINNDWFSGIELRNCLISAGFSPNIPISALRGLKMSWEVLNITPELLAQYGGSYVHEIRGREVTYTKPGTVNINLAIEFPMLEGGLMGLADLSVKYAGVSRQPLSAPTQAPTTPAPGTAEEVEEIMNDEPEADLAQNGNKPEEVVEEVKVS